jgi:ferredoxin
VALTITVNREVCMGSGNCAFWAPGVFDLDDDGIAIVLDPQAQPSDKVVMAAEGCPTQAITVADGDRVLHAGV